MAKVHPKAFMIPTSSADLLTSSNRETLTLWMKSLVINGYGCSVFDSRGQLLLRVDNYQTRCSRKVQLMNLNGQVLYSITSKRRLLVFKKCEGCRMNEEGEWFRVRRKFKFWGEKTIACNIVLGSCNGSTTTKYNIFGLKTKSTLKILDSNGGILAEVMQKQSAGGVCLGDDVLSLRVESEIDRSLVVAMVISYAMINNKL